MKLGKKQLLSLALLASLGLTSANAAKETLTVYTAFEVDQLKEYQRAFNKVHPDIDLRIVRDSTGVIAAKLLAEKDNPQADVVWGVAITGLGVLNAEGLLKPYAPANLAKIDTKFRDQQTPPRWWGLDVTGAVICFNTQEAAKKNLPEPKTWQDLLNPIYKDQIVMPNPSSSGTGYLNVIGWMSMFGEDETWEYMDQLHQNVSQYTHSGSKPCNMAATGEYPIGISFEYRGHSNKKRGAPINLVFPQEGLGWDVEAFAIMEGTDNLEAAQKLADFASSTEAMKLYAKNFAITGEPNVAPRLENIPDDYEARLVEIDFDQAALDRGKILEKWNSRYANKSEAK